MTNFADPTNLILALKITFQHQPLVSQHHQPV